MPIADYIKASIFRLHWLTCFPWKIEPSDCNTLMPAVEPLTYRQADSGRQVPADDQVNSHWRTAAIR